MANTTFPFGSPPVDTVFFAQVSCQSEGGNRGLYMWQKRFLGLLLATIGVFICIYARLTITHISSNLIIEEKLLDYALVSIEDYSVTARISKDFYQDVIREKLDPLVLGSDDT